MIQTKKIKIKRMKIKIEIPNCLLPNLIITKKKKTLDASLIFILFLRAF
jgi:hypothetical protein